MLAFVSELRECRIEALDGEMGKVQDLFFDDRHWAVRYVLIDTGKILPGKKVMLSPASFDNLDIEEKRLHVHYDKEKIRKSPDVSETVSMTNEHETQLADYYGWSKYWLDNMMWGIGGSPIAEKIEEMHPPNLNREVDLPTSAEYSLRSAREAKGVRVHANDGRLGEVMDAIFDTRNWAVQSLVVKITHQPELGLMLLSPNELSGAEWTEGDLYFDGTVDQFKERPIYQSEQQLHEDLPNL